jgi:hypothetical protein
LSDISGEQTVSVVQAFCPSCGAPVEFRRGLSVVVVCEYCRSVVARGDRAIEDLGKVAELVETGSPLTLGLRGAYQGIAFELTGRAQPGHEMGGVWDEWYAAFSDGRWGWLAEAQGRFYLTFRKSLPQQSLIPPYEALLPGQQISSLAGSVALVVGEKGIATSLGAQGEIPYRLVPGERHAFADLSGPRGEFATLDYSDNPPLLYIGREVTLDDLGLGNAIAPNRKAQRVTSHQLNCPNCGGRLELRAPDQAQRVTCPNCNSLLDINQGQLRYLETLSQVVTPAIPIGAGGNFPIGKFQVIGYLQRCVVFEGVSYYWEEYLLYEPKLGFRWLVQSDGHWSFVETLAPGMVTDEGDKARFADQRFKIFQNAQATVVYVLGEFYWKVSRGERVTAVDYVRAPLMLSKEATAQEINWSLATYLKKEDVEKAFGVSGLPAPTGVAPNQPFPHKGIYKLWGWMFLATFLLGLLVMMTGAQREIFQQRFILEARKNADETQTFFSEPFEIRARQNIKVTATAPVNNTWVYVEGDLINEETGLVQPFAIPVEYYSGVDGGESWSEGDRDPDLHLSSVPSGRYTLRIEAQWEKWQEPQMLTVRLVQGVPRLLYWMLALVAVSFIPILILIYQWQFEARRWQDSEFNPYQSSSDDE